MTPFKVFGLLACFANSGAGSRTVEKAKRNVADNELGQAAAVGNMYRSSGGPGATTVDTLSPAFDGCLLAHGYGVAQGCAYPTAFLPVPDCESVNFDEACVQTSNVETVRGYLQDMRSASDYSRLTNTVVQGEGSGWGVRVSASFEYLKTSQVSEKSLAFFIGLGGITQQRTMHQPIALKLTDQARDLLSQNPQGFIQQYGLGYIHSISYGGSFLGSVTVSSRQTSDSTDVDAFASLSVNKGLFSASGAAEFRDQQDANNLEVDTYINALWSGGSDIVANFTDAESVGRMFNEWDRSWRQSPKPLTLSRRGWIDSSEVQEIVNAMSDADRALFTTPPVTPAIMQEISKEDAAVAMMQTSVEKALAWRETQTQQDAEACFRQLSRDVTAMMIIIQGLVEADLVIIQEQWLAGNYSWFRSESLKDGYRQCEELLPAPVPTPAPTVAPVGRRLYLEPLYVNECEYGSSPSETECLDRATAVVTRTTYGVESDASTLSAGSWSALPPGCVVTLGANNRNTWIYYNRYSGGVNNGNYMLVCEAK